jgi:ER lumen protein retaining receptor
MNIFRFLGDLSHLASIIILLHKIQQSRSCRGISFKTQFLYLIVFLTRYVDLLTGPFASVYNTLMKLFFIGSTAYTLYLMRVRYR